MEHPKQTLPNRSLDKCLQHEDDDALVAEGERDERDLNSERGRLIWCSYVPTLVLCACTLHAPAAFDRVNIGRVESDARGHGSISETRATSTESGRGMSLFVRRAVLVYDKSIQL